MKIQFFDVYIGIKIPFSRVSAIIESGHSLLTVYYYAYFETPSKQIILQMQENDRSINRFIIKHPIWSCRRGAVLVTKYRAQKINNSYSHSNRHANLCAHEQEILNKYKTLK